jgi:hydrogenase-4 membrane subunit HyfE
MIMTSLTILITNNWRFAIIALGIQYIGVFVLVNQEWPLGLAAIKLVVGWMAAAVLGLSQMEKKASAYPREPSLPSGWAFRLLAAALVLLIILSVITKVSSWLPGTSLTIIQASLVLIGIGLLQLGMTAQPFKVTIGLLTFIGGFEILYASEERSILVAGLLASVNLGLSLVGSYMILLDQPGDAR